MYLVNIVFKYFERFKGFSWTITEQAYIGDIPVTLQPFVQTALL